METLFFTGGFFMLQNSRVAEIMFSPLIRRSSKAFRIAYVAVFTALLIVANMLLELFKFLDNQYSFTIFFSSLAGVFLGPVLGFSSCILGDAIGFLLNSQGMTYMPWVGLSTGVFAFLAGLILRGIAEDKIWKVLLKIAVFCVVSFLVCTVGINSTGFYLFNKSIGFSTKVLEYFSDKFGGNVTFWGYVAYRLFFKLQILNSVINYALLFAVLPSLRAVKGLRPYL